MSRSSHVGHSRCFNNERCLGAGLISGRRSRDAALSFVRSERRKISFLTKSGGRGGFSGGPKRDDRCMRPGWSSREEGGRAWARNGMKKLRDEAGNRAT